MLSRFTLTIWRAATDASAYLTDFAKRRTGSGIGYLYALQTTLAFFSLLPLAIGLAVVAPSAETFANQHLRVLQNWYPDELTLTISGGVLSTNASEPFILDLPPEWGDGDEGERMHAIVIDTGASVDDFDRYETFALMTEKSFVVRDDKGLRVFPYSRFEENVIINEELVTDLVTTLSDVTPFLPWIAWGLVFSFLAIFPFIIGGIMWAFSLLFLLWATVVLVILSRTNLSYGDIYRLSLFGITNSLLLSFAFTMLHLDWTWITYMLFFGWMIYVLSQFPRSSRTLAPLPPADVLKKSTPASPKKPRTKAA